MWECGRHTTTPATARNLFIRCCTTVFKHGRWLELQGVVITARHSEGHGRVEAMPGGGTLAGRLCAAIGMWMRFAAGAELPGFRRCVIEEEAL